MMMEFMLLLFFTGAIGERRMMDVGFSKITEQRL